jgi:hypothetical protein
MENAVQGCDAHHKNDDFPAHPGPLRRRFVGLQALLARNIAAPSASAAVWTAISLRTDTDRGRQAGRQLSQHVKRRLQGDDVAIGSETADHRLDGG